MEGFIRSSKDGNLIVVQRPVPTSATFTTEDLPHKSRSEEPPQLLGYGTTKMNDEDDEEEADSTAIVDGFCDTVPTFASGLTSLPEKSQGNSTEKKVSSVHSSREINLRAGVVAPQSLVTLAMPSISCPATSLDSTNKGAPGVATVSTVGANTTASIESVGSSLFDIDSSLEDRNPQESIFQRLMGSFRPVFNPRMSLAERSSIDAVHTASTSKILESAAASLLPGRKRMQAQLSGRAAGTVSLAAHHRWDGVGNRTRRIAEADRARASHPVQKEDDAAAVYVAPTAAAVHRALKAEWDDAAALLRSIAVRAIDVTVDDARAVYDFFTVTDLLLAEYLAATAALLGSAGAVHRAAHRAAALAAADRFLAARVGFLCFQGAEQVDELVACGAAARAAVLHTTGAEARGIGGLRDVNIADLANALSKADGGPFLVLMLARGVAGSVQRGKLWAKGVLFPRRFRAPRPFCMQRLVASMHRLHGGHAQVFRAAEGEYREMYASKAAQRAAQRGVPGAAATST